MEDKIYTILYGGMGCLWYVKRDSSSSEPKAFFMHGDSWGQYGTSDVPELTKFLHGYTKVRESEELIKYNDSLKKAIGVKII